MENSSTPKLGFLARQYKGLLRWFDTKRRRFGEFRNYSFKRELIAIGLLVLGSHLAVKRLSVSITPSIDAKLLVKNAAPLERGDYVSFILYDKRAPGGHARVMKKLLCLPGELLERQGNAFFCNGSLLGVVQKIGSDGKQLTSMQWRTGYVPRNYAYVGSGRNDSYDSRYFGLISLRRLERYEKLF
jgi:conjugal transfer pilin signal peptidase TrbI